MEIKHILDSSIYINENQNTCWQSTITIIYEQIKLTCVRARLHSDPSEGY